MKYFTLLLVVFLIGSVWATSVTPEMDKNRPDRVPNGVQSPEQALHFFDSFEAYVPVTPLCVQTSNWIPWGGVPGAADDPLVSNAQAATGSNSVVILQNDDLVWEIGTPVTTGLWRLSWKMYIPNGQAGYFNTLTNFGIGGVGAEWAMQAYFDAGGTGRLDAGGASAAIFSYTYDTWMPVEVIIDLDNDVAEFWLDNALIYTWQYTLGTFGTPVAKQFDANDFFGATANDEMYIDDYTVEEVIPDWLFWDNFDGYTAGVQLALQNPVFWSTWSGPTGTGEDPMVSNLHSQSVSNSVVIVQNNDLVKTFGSLTSGKWQIEFSIYIPSGKSGYFNTLAGFTPNPFDWGMEVYFDAGGGGRLIGVPGAPIAFSWTPDTWQGVMVIVDLDNDMAEFWFAGSMVGSSWQWTQGGAHPLRLDANDFYGAAATDEMYFDDYSIIQLSPPVIPPSIGWDPTSITDTVAVNDSMDYTIQIENTAVVGALALDWSASISFAKTKSNSLRIPRASANIPRALHAPSMGRAPLNAEGAINNDGIPNLDPSLAPGNAWSLEQVNGFIAYFDLATPQVLNNLGPDPTGAGFDNAHEFGLGDQSFFYNLDSPGEFSKIDTTTGAVTILGTITPPGAQTWAGMATDPTTGTIYAVSTDLATSSLSIIDPVGISSTLVGATGSPGLISVAIDGNGDMWAHDLVSDNFLSIDKTTGTATVVGPLGFNANFGQGMTWDPASDQLYMAAFNGTTILPELRIVDKTTGGSTVVGQPGQTTPGGTCQLGSIAIPGASGGQLFIKLLPPTSGTIDPGDFTNLDVRVYGLTVDDTTYMADIIISSNDPVNPTVTIPVEIYVPEVTGIYDPNQTPYTFAISQNYPNPFNPSTTIEYQVPRLSQVTISVYDLLGQKIKTLVNDNMEPGSHQVTWNGVNDAGAQVGSGVYFYRFQADDFVSIKKMMFLK